MRPGSHFNFWRDARRYSTPNIWLPQGTGHLLASILAQAAHKLDTTNKKHHHLISTYDLIRSHPGWLIGNMQQLEEQQCFIAGVNDKTCLDNHVRGFMLPLASCSHVRITKSPCWLLIHLLHCLLRKRRVSLLYLLIKRTMYNISKHMQNKSTVWYLQYSRVVAGRREWLFFLSGSLALFMGPHAWYILN